MASVEESLKTSIGENAAVAGVIGTNFRPWPLGVDPVLPAVRYFIVTAPTTQAVDGSIHERRPRVQLTIWADEPADRETLAPLLIAAALAMPGYVEVADEARDSVDGPTGLFRRDIDIRWLR